MLKQPQILYPNQCPVLITCSDYYRVYVSIITVPLAMFQLPQIIILCPITSVLRFYVEAGELSGFRSLQQPLQPNQQAASQANRQVALRPKQSAGPSKDRGQNAGHQFRARAESKR